MRILSAFPLLLFVALTHPHENRIYDSLVSNRTRISWLVVDLPLMATSCLCFKFGLNFSTTISNFTP
jgi:hypothetical protein